MLFNLATIAALSSSALAAPWGVYGSGSGAPSSGSSGQIPFKFPLPNGFPNIKVPSSALTAIELQAHGTLPNGPLPTTLTDLSATTFQGIAFGELFEVAYFTSLLDNITNNVGGYQLSNGVDRTVVLNALTAIQAQEELHTIGANAILSSAHRTPVQPCEYIFPVDNFDDAILVASAFTDVVVLGGLQDALNNVATDGDTEVVPLLTSIVGQEGEQNGFFRSIEGKIPSALPFLTRSTAPFAFSFINQFFVVNGTCPTPIDLPIFNRLTVQTQEIQAKDQQIDFSFVNVADVSTTDLSLVYINQQDLPIVEPVQNLRVNGEEVTFCADFPYTKFEMNGLTIAVVTNSSGPFTSADEVAMATLFGPGVIEIN